MKTIRTNPYLIIASFIVIFIILTQLIPYEYKYHIVVSALLVGIIVYNECVKIGDADHKPLIKNVTVIVLIVIVNAVVYNWDKINFGN